MAYFTEVAITSATGTGGTMNMPSHSAGDLLVAVITLDSGAPTIGGSTWLQVTGAAASVTQGTIVTLRYLIAASDAETLTVTVADAYTCGVYCFKDVDNTTPFDGVTPSFAGVGTASYTMTTAAVTTGTANALVFHAVCQDGTTPQALSRPGVMSITNFDATGTTATTSSHQSAAWYIQRSTGATPIATFESAVSGAYVRITLALRNASGGRIPAYVDDVTTCAEMLTGGHHIVTANNISYSAAAAANITGTIAGKTVTVAAAANGADFGINPYCNAAFSTAAATAATALVGPELVLTGGRNLTGKLVVGSFIAGTPKMGAFGLGTVAQGGVVVRLASGANNWNAYQVSAKDATVNPVQRAVFAVQPGYDGSDYAVGASGSAAASAVLYLQMLRNAPSFSSTIYGSEFHAAGVHVIAGGDATTPVDSAGLVECGASYRLPVIQAAGSGGVVSFVPLQIGGGDAVNFQIDASSLQFPRRADPAKKDIQFHAQDNYVGISYAGKSGDVIKHTNSLISSPTSFYWEINSAATSAAAWDFAGTSIINALVTLRPVATFSNVSFTDCTSVTLNASTVANCKFDNSPLIADTPTAAALVSSSSLTSGGTGHAMTIGSATAVPGSPASITLTDLTFTGYAATNGSTGNEAINVLYTSGTLTINYTSASTPYIKTAGATVIVQNSKPVTVTVKDAGTLAAIESARVRIVTTVGGNVVIEGLTNASGVLTGSTTYIGSDVTGTIRRASTGLGDGKLYKPYEISGAVSAEGLDVSALMTSDE